MTMQPGGDPRGGLRGGGSANFARCMDGRTSYTGGGRNLWMEVPPIEDPQRRGLL